MNLRNVGIALGPIVTALTGTIVAFVHWKLVQIPAPGALMFLPVLFAAYIGGLGAGLIANAIAVGFGAWFVLDPSGTPLPQALLRLAMLAVATTGTTVIVSLLRTRAARTLGHERADRDRIDTLNHELLALRAALNQIHLGVLLLDKDMRLSFMNAAMRQVGHVPDALADSKPTLEQLLRFGCGTGIFPVATDRLEAYIAQRQDTVFSGNLAPQEIRLGDGEIARAQCAILPDGGRLMTYTIVTDLVRRNEELAAFHAVFDQSDVGMIILDPDLRSRYINRAFRKQWRMTDETADSQPDFAELMKHGRDSGTFQDMKPEELRVYLEQRMAAMRRADPTPRDLRLRTGEVVRFRCTALPDGGRLLSYTNVSDLVHNADRLEELATTDGMSNLYNRRHFLTLAETEWARFERYKRPLSLLMIDIDRFKSINDTLGHAVGDQVIVDIAEICRAQRRASDIVARLGGEEFVVMLPETGIDDAIAIAERLRAQIEARELMIGQRVLKFTVSIGVSEATTAMADTTDLIKQADRSLYMAKRNGRNRVCTADPLGDPQETQSSSAA